MSHQIRGLLMGVRDVLIQEGRVNQELLDSIIKLVNFCKKVGIEPVFFSNSQWTVNVNGKRVNLDNALEDDLPGIKWFIAQRGDCNFKPLKASIHSICSKMGWEPYEIIYLGNTDEDMRAAVNSEVLFLKATWYNTGSRYGLEFKTVKDVARFIDIFCRRNYLWHFEIKNNGLEYYSLAPFSTLTRQYEQYIDYSKDAKSAAKFGGGHPEFWEQYLWSTFYLSRIHEKIDYITCYPGHLASSGPNIMEEPLYHFAGCFHARFLPDLIIRHTDAKKLQAARTAGTHVSHLDQLNTICLNPNPMKNLDQSMKYKKSPLKKGKTVLVIDDFCTRGYSLEAARLNIMQTGARVICVSWLKTINTGYEEIKDKKSWNPYTPQVHTKPKNINVHSYYGAIAEKSAADEVDEKFKRFCAWEWED